MSTLNYRTFQDLARCIRDGLKRIPNDWDLIVGIPRSGMIPAYMIGLMLNRKVCSLDEFIYGIEPSNGERKIKQNFSDKKRKVLIVDDSIHSGVAINKAKQRIKNYDMSNMQIFWLAIYAREESKNVPDFYFEIVPCPRVFEWNYLNSNIISRSCFDMDGVLCVDPTEDQNDDGERYLDFIANATQLFIPQIKIHTIVTSRLEKYRSETEQWLKKHNVEYGKLIMLNLPSKEERIRLKAHASFKAQVYGSLKDTYVFYESDRKQALQISSITKKPCFCVETDELFYGYENEMSEVTDMLPSEKIKGTKVLLYSHELTYTGAPHSLLRICKILLEHQCKVEVWSPIDGNFKVEFENEHIPVRIVENPALKSPKYIKLISSFDIAIANTVLSHRFYLAASKLIPTIWFIREALNLPSMVDKVPERRQALIDAPLLYCVSELAENFINARYNPRTRVVHNCVEDYYTENSEDNLPQNITGKPVNFIIVGNLKYNKGFDLVVKAFKEMSSEIQENSHLYLVGRLPENDKDYWEAILNEVNTSSEITYLGEITDTQKKIETFRAMDVFIIASRSESCSLVALEAAMLGKPIILNENVGAKYIVTKDSGWIVKANDAEALKLAMEMAVSNASKLKIMGANSRRNYLQTSTIEQYDKSIVKMIVENLPNSLQKDINSNTYILQQNTIKSLQKEIREIHNSWTYKIGRLVTFVPRKVRGGIRCYKENGLKYTLKRVVEKIKRI